METFVNDANSTNIEKESGWFEARQNKQIFTSNGKMIRNNAYRISVVLRYMNFLGANRICIDHLQSDKSGTQSHTVPSL